MQTSVTTTILQAVLWRRGQGESLPIRVITFLQVGVTTTILWRMGGGTWDEEQGCKWDMGLGIGMGDVGQAKGMDVDILQRCTKPAERF